MSVPEDHVSFVSQASRKPRGGDGRAASAFGVAALARLVPVVQILGGLGLFLALCGGALALAGMPVAALVVAVAAISIMVLALIAALGARHRRKRRARVSNALAQAMESDPDPVLVTDPEGTVCAANQAGAAQALDPVDGMRGWCVSPEVMRDTLLAETARRGAASREFWRRSGGLRVTCNSVERALGDGVVVWRFAPIRRGGGRSVDALGLAVLSVDDEGVHPNPAALTLLGCDAAQAGPLLAGLDSPGGDLRTDRHGAETGGAEPVPVMLTLRDGRTCQAVPLASDTASATGGRDLLLLPALPAGTDSQAAPHASAFEDIPVALLQIGPDGRVGQGNRHARSLLGLEPDARPWFSEVVEGLGRPVNDWLDDARLGRALGRPEVLRVTLREQETFVQIILRRAQDVPDSGALVAVISDATELKTLEARFVQSQKMQAIGQLAGGIAHDFNNLLTAIAGHCDLLLLNRDRFDPDYSDLLQIHQNTNRAAALVRQLLAFSRKQSLTPEIVGVENLLEDLTHLLTRLVGEHINLDRRHHPDVGAIRADKRQLEQVILNLVVNARDAMPMGGTIRIETEIRHLARETDVGRARLPEGDYVLIHVIDQGFGIAPSVIDKIFEPFFTTKKLGEGTGLGLSTAYGIVKQMGGYIFADSVEGAGTTFTLYFGAIGERPAVRRDPRPAGAATLSETHDDLDAGHGLSVHDTLAALDRVADEMPATTDTAATGPAPRPRAPTDPALKPRVRAPGAPRGGGAILLVEDEAPVRAFAARALRLQGYQVFEAQDGEQALDFLQDPGLRVDLFVSDVVMPGIDGPGWVAKALENRPGTPVLFVSGYTEDALRATISGIPGAIFLGKPFSLKDLSETIAGQLSRQSGKRSPASPAAPASARQVASQI
ncbi:hybrid sensor histidine kinase/response regulator [Pararhodobacter marinus]|uniref:hybrid sensor histidine kinase/response regulator n=1 Tax=Pararhodobacter marinus TaxID=2184063 RepID=UPI003519C74E